MNVATAAAVAVLFGCGIHLMVRGDAIKMCAGTLLISNAAILLLMSVGLGSTVAPLVPVASTGSVSDPLVQALAITASVIGFATTVLLLQVARVVVQTHHSLEVAELVEAETAEGQDEGDAEPPIEHRPSGDDPAAPAQETER